MKVSTSEKLKNLKISSCSENKRLKSQLAKAIFTGRKEKHFSQDQLSERIF